MVAVYQALKKKSCDIPPCFISHLVTIKNIYYQQHVHTIIVPHIAYNMFSWILELILYFNDWTAGMHVYTDLIISDSTKSVWQK